jgi:hypothetical protein
MQRPSLFLLLLLHFVPMTRAEAQRAMMNVTAQVLPPREALIGGTVELRQETGYAMTATASVGKLSARRIAAPIPRDRVLGKSEAAGIEISVDLVVGTNVHYQAELRSDTGSVGLPALESSLHSGSAATSRKMRIVLPPQAPNSSSALTIVLIASSIT